MKGWQEELDNWANVRNRFARAYLQQGWGFAHLLRNAQAQDGTLVPYSDISVYITILIDQRQQEIDAAKEKAAIEWE